MFDYYAYKGLSFVSSRINGNVSKIVYNLIFLSKKDYFYNESFIQYKEHIYNVSYKYMKLEFLYYNNSKIFDYVITNKDICNTFKSKIKEDIEELNNSINFIPGAKEVNILLESCKNPMNRKLLSILVYALYLSKSNEIMKMKYNQILIELKQIERKLDRLLKGKKQLNYYKRLYPLKIEFNKILYEYKKLKKEYSYLINDNNIIEIKYIDDIILKLDRLSITKKK